MSLGMMVLTVLVLILLGVIPTWPPQQGMGLWSRTGRIGLVLLIVLILLLLGKI